MHNVLLADGRHLERFGLRGLLKSSFPETAVSEAENLTELHARLACHSGIDVVLMDTHWPDQDGLAVFADLFQLHPHLTFVLLVEDRDSARRALTLGAAAAIRKTSSCQEIAQILMPLLSHASGAHSGNDQTDPAKKLASLSPAQLRILKGLEKGLRNKQIAFEMGVTENTVKTYISMMYRRLGVSSRTQALFLLREALSAA